MSSPKHKKGDWISFYRNGTIVISEIRYINKNVLGGLEYNTYLGTVSETSILEVRRKLDND